MPLPPGPVRTLWYRWKSIRFPWRKRWLCGLDLAGNTFWEFKDQLNANRFRRIVKFSRHTHYGDVKITPQWHQWLRHLREEAPTLAEQESDVVRQRQMKALAAAADERWASKPSALDAPTKAQPLPATGSDDIRASSTQAAPKKTKKHVDNAPFAQGAKDAEKPGTKTRASRNKLKESPWTTPKGNPGDDWQPTSWTPEANRKRA